MNPALTTLAPWSAVGSLVLSALALGLAAWQSAEMRRDAARAEDWRELHGRCNTLLAAFQKAQTPREPAGHTATSAPEPSGDVELELAPMSLLEDALTRVNDPLSTRLQMLARCEAAAGVRLPEAVALRHRNRELNDAQSMAQVDSAEQEIEAAWAALLPALVSQTDRDLDRARTNEALQEALAELTHDLGMTLLDPSAGTPFDPATQISLGSLRPGTEHERGTVGQVRCRGLRGARGDVLLRAEILEFT